MSYCRFSTSDFVCDLYVYADAGGGYTTHVARNRTVFAEPLPPPVPFTAENLPAWMERHKTVQAELEDATYTPIDLPHAGESFYNLDKDATLSLLAKLKELGYKFPDYVIDDIESETEDD